MHLLDAADADLEDLGSRFTEQDLQAMRTRPNKPSSQPGWFWLIRNYGHAHEHLAPLQITRQLYLLTCTKHLSQVLQGRENSIDRVGTGEDSSGT